MLDKTDILKALTRIGVLAAAEGRSLDLLLMGGGVMVLVFEARLSTRDLDVMFLPPADAAWARTLAAAVAAEMVWPTDWLNDAAKAFLVGDANGPTIFSAPGIEVRRPSFEQLLAMKLCAWRDDVDIADARRLLQELAGGCEDVWSRIVPHLQPGRELKARYAFDDLWEEHHGDP